MYCPVSLKNVSLGTVVFRLLVVVVQTLKSDVDVFASIVKRWLFFWEQDRP